MEKIGFCPYFLKNLTQCPLFETIKYRVPISKPDFNKIELQIELDFNKVKFYAYFAA